MLDGPSPLRARYPPHDEPFTETAGGLILPSVAHYWDGPKGQTERAPRFAIHVPVLVRTVGETAWHQFQTENISRTGVLFHTDSVMDLNTPVEMGLVLMADGDPRPAPQVICVGDIVRAASPGESSPAVAARFRDYRFVGGHGAR